MTWAAYHAYWSESMAEDIEHRHIVVVFDVPYYRLMMIEDDRIVKRGSYTWKTAGEAWSVAQGIRREAYKLIEKGDVTMGDERKFDWKKLHRDVLIRYDTLAEAPISDRALLDLHDRVKTLEGADAHTNDEWQSLSADAREEYIRREKEWLLGRGPYPLAPQPDAAARLASLEARVAQFAEWAKVMDLEEDPRITAKGTLDKLRELGLIPKEG